MPASLSGIGEVRVELPVRGAGFLTKAAAAAAVAAFLAWPGLASAETEQETAPAEAGGDGQRPWGPPPPASSEPSVEPIPDPAAHPGPQVAPNPDGPQVETGGEASMADGSASTPVEPQPPVPAPNLGGQTSSSDQSPVEPQAQGASPAAGSAPAPEPDAEQGPADAAQGLRLGNNVLMPFVTIVGGANYHHIVPRDDPGLTDERQGRFTTVAMTRFGLEGRFGDHVSIRSELELNAGPHGTSVWEGQAAMSVMDQYLRLTFGAFQLDAGRVTDLASIDYFSAHVANLLLTDDYVRTPFLYSGANRGNGILARYEVLPGLKIGLTVNAGNPLSNTGSAMFGGTYGIFTRFYTQAQGSVADSPRTFPDDKFYVFLVSPSLTYEWEHLRAQFSFQYMVVDVSMSDDDNPGAEAQNLRGGIQGLLWGGRVRPFVNFSHVMNHTFDARGSTPIVDEVSQSVFEGMTVSGGIDVDFLGPTGVGIQYNYVSEQVGDYNPVTSRHYLNIGGSWWFLPWVCAEARYAFFMQCEDVGAGAECGSQHHHNFYLTLRGVFGLGQARAGTSI